jgi:hypothetical protein
MNPVVENDIKNKRINMDKLININIINNKIENVIAFKSDAIFH